MLQVHIADRINSIKPDQPNSPTTHDPHTTTHNSTTSTRQPPRSLNDQPDPYTISARPIPDHFPSLLERLASRSLLEFVDMPKIIVYEAGPMQSNVDHPKRLPNHSCRASQTSPRSLDRAWPSWSDRQCEPSLINSPRYSMTNISWNETHLYSRSHQRQWLASWTLQR